MSTRSLALASVLVSLLATAGRASAAEPESRLNVMAGLMQWTAFGGGNLAAEYMHGRFVLEVSHGQALDLNQLSGFALTSAERDAGLHVFVPWTTGFGVGYRVTGGLHVLVELKAHHYEVSARDRGEELDYTTFSVGPGVFYTIPLWRGLFLEPNVRWWPNVASTLSGGRGVLHDADGTAHAHEAHDFGLFANVNLGWRF